MEGVRPSASIVSPAGFCGPIGHSGGNARRLRSFGHLVSLGLIWGLVVPLSGVASTLGASALVLTAWVSIISSAFCLGRALIRRRLVLPSGDNILFFLGWAVLGTVIPQTLLFWVSSRLASSTISIIVILEGFMVFGLAAVFRQEAPTLRRFVGLTLGLGGTVPILAGADAGAVSDIALPLTLLAVLGVPLCYAAENLLIASCKPDCVDSVAGVGIMQALGAAMSFGIAVLLGYDIWPDAAFGRLHVVVVLLGLCAAVANYLFQSLITSTGSVFAGQSSYLVTLAGIGWSMVLLDESVSPWIGLSLAPIFLGVLLVSPRAVGASTGR